MNDALFNAIQTAEQLADQIRTIHTLSDAVAELTTDGLCRDAHELLHRLTRLQSAFRAVAIESAD